MLQSMPNIKRKSNGRRGFAFGLRAGGGSGASERSEATQREPGLRQTHSQADSGLRSKALPAAEESATTTRKPNRINPSSRCIPLLPTLVVDLSRSCVIIGAAVHSLKPWCLRLFCGTCQWMVSCPPQNREEIFLA